MIHIVDGRSPAELPRRRRTAAAGSLSIHGLAVGLALIAAGTLQRTATTTIQPVALSPITVDHLIFIAGESSALSGGGGGGGNRQTAAIRRAEGAGTDRATLRVAKPSSDAGRDQQ